MCAFQKVKVATAAIFTFNSHEAIRLGAPQALQVADRFHLVMNATKTLEALFIRDSAVLQAATRTLRATARSALPPASLTVYSHQRQSEQRRTRRHATYARV